MDQKRGIGKDNKLLWHIPEDLKRFKEITNGHPIIMGRKTFESIGRVLPNRTNIIITKDTDYSVKGALVVHSLEDAIREAKEYKVSSIMYQVKNDKTKNTKYKIHDTDEDEVLIIGGGQIFEQALPLVQKIYLTVVEGDFGADTFFPEVDEFIKVKEEKKDDGNYVYSFVDLIRK